MFNALKYTQELERAGFSRDQAETSVRLIIEIMNDSFATKADLKETEMRLESRMDRIEASLREAEYRLTIKLGAMMTLAVGIVATLVTLSRR